MVYVTSHNWQRRSETTLFFGSESGLLFFGFNNDLVSSYSIIPNPKTSGNGRYSYLAAWGYALKKSAGVEARAGEFLGGIFANVPVLDTGGRAATTTFVQRSIGDVLLTFENEIALTLKESGGENLQPRK